MVSYPYFITGKFLFSKSNGLNTEGISIRVEFVLIWIVLALVCMPASGTKILDHSMASNIDESTNSVITRTYEFSTADSRAYSWLSLGNVGDGTVEWRWYSPDGNLYKTISVNIAPYSDGANWPSYNIWSYIDVAGDLSIWVARRLVCRCLLGWS
jgi:hypothetical protein